MDELVGVVEYGSHLLKLGLWGQRFEGGLLELFAKVVDLGFGILAATDLVGPVPAGYKTEAEREQCCSFHADFSRVEVCSCSTRWMVAREARCPLASWARL